MVQMPVRAWAGRVLVLLTAGALVGVFWWIFRGFFPTPSGRLGHDYAYFLPALLSGFYWFHVNGFRAVPWFTPALCGGVPLYPNPESLYYSLPQFLTFLTDPLSAVRVTFVTFAAVGFAGAYALLRTTFRLDAAAALFGATTVLFNGYYAHRMIIGHLGFHSVMLVPLVAHLLLRPAPPTPVDRRWRLGLDASLAGLCVAYMIQSGNHDLLPWMLSVVGIALVFMLSGGAMNAFWLRALTALGIAVLVCASKLTSGFAFLGAFPRSGYPRPASGDLLGLVSVAVQSLFLWPAHEAAESIIVNSAWTLERQEFEYGVSLVPALLLGALFIARAGRWLRGGPQLPRLERGRTLQWGGLVLLLALPILLNYDSHAWNSVLRRIPILKHYSNFVRWFGLYIPIVAVGSSVALNRLGPSWLRGAAAAAGIITVVTLNAATDRTYYLKQPYDPTPVLQAHRLAAETGLPRPIRLLGSIDALNRNDLLTLGISPITCYEGIFGYGLEWFPGRELRPGPALGIVAGRLNLANPACYVFPESNHCRPGDRFPVARADDAECFAGYRSFPFKRPRSQAIADGANVVGFLALAVFLLLYLARSLRRSLVARPAPWAETGTAEESGRGTSGA